METWWEGCLACNDDGSDPHDYRHPACIHNPKSNEDTKNIFKNFKRMKDEEYTLYFVDDKDGNKITAVIIRHHDNPTKVSLRTSWGKNGGPRTWEGEICDNQTKIKWFGRRGVSFWNKIA